MGVVYKIRLDDAERTSYLTAWGREGTATIQPFSAPPAETVALVHSHWMTALDEMMESRGVWVWVTAQVATSLGFKPARRVIKAQGCTTRNPPSNVRRYMRGSDDAEAT